MATINQMLKRWQSIDIDTAIPKIIQQTSFEITSLVQLQMQDGEDSSGKKTKPSYKSKSYATKKAALNPKAGYGNPDFFVSGSLYQGMGVVIMGKDKFNTQSTVSYFGKLEDYYKKNGSTVFKLSEKSKSQYARQTFYRGLRAYVTGVTQLR